MNLSRLLPDLHTVANLFHRTMQFHAGIVGGVLYLDKCRGGGGVAHIVKRSHVLSAQARFRFENENENEKVSIGYL